MTEQQLILYAMEEGFHSAVIVDTKDIVFDASFRRYCEDNYCGQYGVNYSCPPDCGTTDAMKQKILAHKKAIVLQTIWDIPDYTDKEMIRKTKGSHNASTIRLAQKARAEGCDGFMVGASGCSLCTPCALRSGAPCRFPDLQYSCMSAYCIFVKELADHCGMQYFCGEGKVAFFGMYVFD